ncbi:hypothetical protein ElyMa_004319000 [Elysia marginata]|uniref:Uncharacterized protein n=1 Tax=Elysia marginata TaxID=1093978 RepID=A0AAV4GZP2_9GAST|nr:hypothetical protein ElyMa_004319000 [Elysia marginata]
MNSFPPYLPPSPSTKLLVSRYDMSPGSCRALELPGQGYREYYRQEGRGLSEEGSDLSTWSQQQLLSRPVLSQQAYEAQCPRVLVTEGGNNPVPTDEKATLLVGDT